MTHTLKLPMYVGSVRTMVVAGRNGAYGNAGKDVLCTDTINAAVYFTTRT